MANIKITSNKDIFIVEISDDMDIFEYYEKSKKVDECGVTNMLSNNIMWNSSNRKMNKGQYYIFQIDNGLYNIFIGDFIAIDERYREKDTKYERIIRYSSMFNSYHYHQMEHDKNNSTSNIKYYDSNGERDRLGVLTRSEAYKLINEMLTKLINSNKAKGIIDVELMKENILTSINNSRVKTYEKNGRGSSR